VYNYVQLPKFEINSTQSLSESLHHLVKYFTPF